MLFEDKNIEILGSREAIREQLTDFAKTYLELESVDLYKTSFLSYLINVLSILSSNQMFYSSTVYKEFFFLRAQLIDSVNNLARWIGYVPPNATPASVNVLISMPLGFTDQEVTLIIPDNFTVSASGIKFKINTSFNFGTNLNEVTSEVNDMVAHGATVRILENRVVTVQDPNGFYYPVAISIDENRNATASFSLPFTQVETLFTSFQVPADLELYQFFTKRLTDLSGQVSEEEIYVVPSNAILPPGISITDIDTLDEFNTYLNADQRAEYKWERADTGIYTLTQSDKKYSWTSFNSQAEIIFGNGVLGQQPQQDSTIFVIMGITSGEDGNVIPGSITTGDTILYQDVAGRVRRVAYSVTNTAAASGGKNELTSEEIKNNAITNLRSRERLVTSGDYTDFDTIVENVPLETTVPILKRSDIKVNEFMIFSELVNTSIDGVAEIVPTRNIAFAPDATSIPTFYVPRGTVPHETEFNDFETMFGMTVNVDTNTAEYEYVLDNATVNASLDSTDPNYNPHAYISIPQVEFDATLDPGDPNYLTVAVNAIVTHVPTSEITQFRCKIKSMWDGLIYNMATVIDPSDPTLVTSFSYDYSDFLDFPQGTVQFQFTIEGYIPYDLVSDEDKLELGWGPAEAITKPSAWLPISVYSTSLVIRRDLSEFMLSTVTQDTSGPETVYRVHNVPVVLSAYLAQEDFDLDNYEVNVLQTLVTNININCYRMLTDFVNIKFPDTTCKLTNMQYNPFGQTVISRSLTSVPTSAMFGDSYIINGSEGTDSLGNDWNDYINYIATWNGARWTFSPPTFDDFVLIDNIYVLTDPDQDKKLIFTGSRWIEPIFDIPFGISLKIIQNPVVATSTTALVNSIRTELINQLSSKFGLDQDIDRSEIIKIVRSVEGVKFAELIEPQVDIRFRFNITDLTQEDLLDYTPQLVAFTEDTISITVVN